MNNKFGFKVYEIKDIFKDKSVEENIRKMFYPVLRYFGASKKAEKIIDDCIKLAKSYEHVFDYEKKAHKIMRDEGIVDKVPKKLAGRARIIYKQIKSYVINGSVLDLGCGDGEVGNLLCGKDKQVCLCDVYKHGNINNLNLKFKLYKQGECCPFPDEEFNNVLILTVLHHSADPVKLTRECRRITKPGGRVIVIESVYGISGKELTPEERKKIKSYLNLSEEQQRMINIFFDHFYNRIFFYNKNPKTKVNVPFNFNTPSGWKKVFKNNGFSAEKIIYFGVDQPVVPEYHVLYVLKKKK